MLKQKILVFIDLKTFEVEAASDELWFLVWIVYTKDIFTIMSVAESWFFMHKYFSKNNDESLTMLRTINREKLSPSNYWTIFTMSVFYELNCIRKICRRAEKLGGDKPSRSVSNEVKIQGFLQQRISINCNRFCYLWAFLSKRSLSLN